MSARRRLAPRLLALDPLEDRRLMTATTVEPVFHDLLDVSVVGRRVFYNNSSFDGNNPAANSADDAAVASDKSALLPGGTASFANYTSYSRGLNGVMIDIAGLPGTKLTAADFDFRVGNTGDPSTWATAPAPTSITVRGVVGLANGAETPARVEIIWPDGAIQKTWLQVTVKATPATGLKQNDVFYFGNAVGESGNSAGNTLVDSADQQGAHDNPGIASITSPFDFDRNGMVDGADESIAANNTTTAASALQRIGPPVVAPAPIVSRLPTAIFVAGDGGFPYITSPAIVTTKNGTVLAFAEGRATKQVSDLAAYAILMRRSTDGGVTFSSVSAVFTVPPGAGLTAQDISPIVDLETGNVFVVFNEGQVVDGVHTVNIVDIIKSSDDGLTWTDLNGVAGQASDITTSVAVTAAGNPGPPGYWDNAPWGWIAVGPGHGIQLQHGPYAGRLLLAVDHRLSGDRSGTSWAHVMYSDDHGQTWHLGGGLRPNSDGTNSPNDNSNESTLAERSDGSIYMASRVNSNFVHNRGRSISFDGGINWLPMSLVTELTNYDVEGTLLRLNDHTLVFASPNSVDVHDVVARHEMTLWLSFDDGLSWTRKKTIFFGYSGYSDMTLVGPDTILLTFTRGFIGGAISGGVSVPGASAEEVALERINLAWLMDDSPYQFQWHFNEQPPGGFANRFGPSIQDYGPWDQRAWAYTPVDPQASYVAGPNGDSALRLTEGPSGFDEVVLSQSSILALQMGAFDSMTFEVVMRTSDADGVIIGSRPNVANYTLQVVGGKLQFSLFDLTNTSSITSDAAINDGNWHRIVAVRDFATRQLRLYVDGAAAANPVADTTTGSMTNRGNGLVADPIVLGSYNSQVPSSQLAFDVDVLRITRAALAESAFLPANFVSPTPPPAPVYPANSPLSLPGLQLWLPPYDPTRYFSDFGQYANPLPLHPVEGTSTRSMLDASPNGYHVSTDSELHQLLYGHDSVVGPYWKMLANSAGTLRSDLQVNSSNSTSPRNFDFVQNTGVFTLSTFVKVVGDTGNYQTIFDTDETSPDKAGFSLLRRQDGSLFLSVTSGNQQNQRFYSAISGSNVATGAWYHVAIVGSGAGNPIQAYVTSVGNANITQITADVLTGSDGVYPTSIYQDLYIGGRSRSISGAQPGAAPFNGHIVNPAIYNTALTPAQIQQLYVFGKSQAAPSFPWQNQANPFDVDGNGSVQPLDALLVINRLLRDGSGPLAPPAVGTTPSTYIDVTGNNSLEPLDALRVINAIINPGGASPAAVTAVMVDDQPAGVVAGVVAAPAIISTAAEKDFSLSIADSANTGGSTAQTSAQPLVSIASQDVTVTPRAPATVVAVQAIFASETSNDDGAATNSNAIDEFFEALGS